jgi:hypothetical protein
MRNDLIYVVGTVEVTMTCIANRTGREDSGNFSQLCQYLIDF